MNRYIPDDVTVIERNGMVFFVHPRRRYAAFIPLAVAAAPLVISALGTAAEVKGTLEQGEQAEEISEKRAAIDERNADAVRDASVEEAKIRSERGRRLLATQKSQAAASGVLINVGAPLVIAAETQANITQDIGFALKGGRIESQALVSSAGLEREIGSNIRDQSRFAATGKAIKGFGTIANLASDRFGGRTKTPKTTNRTLKGTFES